MNNNKEKENENKSEISIKLTNQSNKYLTMINDNPKMKSKHFSKNQSVSYNAQGELIVNNKCLTNNDERVYFDKCDDDCKNKQMWEIKDNKIFPANSPEMCLSYNVENNKNDDNIKLEKCSETNSQIWNIEDSDVARSQDYNQLKYKGKTIVLVDSENPWYLNYDTTIPIEYIKEQKLQPMKQYRDSADFGSHENLEFEHFKADKKKVNNKNKNNNNNNEIQNQILFLLFCIVLLLIIYKNLVKNKYHTNI
jgi:hypothetical protein